jgi:hypothetical protein
MFRSVSGSGCWKLGSLGGLPMDRDWRDAYRVAVLETNQHKLAEKINSASAVLRNCLQEISSADQPSANEQQSAADEQQSTRERQQITDALRILDMIRRTELDIPV